METWGQFAREMLFWLRERFGAKFAALALFLVVACLAAGATTSFHVLFLQLWCMTLCLRLLDDLTSVSADKTHFPERVLCKSKLLVGFWVGFLCLIGLVAIALAESKSPFSAIAWVVLNLFLFFVSRSPFKAKVWLVLLKYPSIVAIAAMGSHTLESPLRLGFVLTAVTVAMFSNEKLHDESLRGKAISQRDHVVRYSIFSLETLIFWIIK